MVRLRVMYGGVVFLSAFLLFAVEPMAAKQLLPVLGGSSAVWVTCLVFFQAVLLLGYLYAHWMARRGTVRLHVMLLSAAAVALMMVWAFGILMRSSGIEMEFGSSAWEHPVSTIFSTLGMTIGLPFLMLGSTSPLLQVWWARREGGAVPYRLFALSNAGSLLALALYPLAIEPHMTLAQQRDWWMVGFVVYAALGVSLAIQTRKDKASVSGAFESGGRAVSTSAQGDTIGGTTAGRRWMWFLLPMGAAMQLCAVTSHLSQDIAAIPLLWILPLATYLLTFILAFETPGLYRRWIVGRFLAVMLAALGYALSKMDMSLPVGLGVLFYLVEIFVACWFLHAEAYRLRPANDADQSTVFYLLVAAGGVVGTFFVAIASPMIFRANYDLAIAFVVTAVLAAAVTWEEGWPQRVLWCTGSVLLLGLTVLLHIEIQRQAVMTARNFYGSLRVTSADFDDQGGAVGGKNRDGSASTGTGPVRVLMNGRIRHGTQMTDEGRNRIPTTYYGVDSGIGVALHNCCEGRAKNVGVIGLGAGTLAAYGEAGDRFRFYEINPRVEPIARNLFTYLHDSRAAISVVDGDGRASLNHEKPQGFDVLVVDAFSGDAIPLHLLTKEAMDVYRRHLAPGGVVAFHVSNSYLNLAPEIGRLADAEGMQARVVESMDVPAEGAYRATWVLVSEDARFFERPGVAAVALPVQGQAGLRLWTDDYSSLLPVLRLGR
ncbi:MAG TPA: fused MFS/spermidine synthase [Acidobacteriaceae bacterium]